MAQSQPASIHRSTLWTYPYAKSWPQASTSCRSSGTRWTYPPIVQSFWANGVPSNDELTDVVVSRSAAGFLPSHAMVGCFRSLFSRFVLPMPPNVFPGPLANQRRRPTGPCTLLIPVHLTTSRPLRRRVRRSRGSSATSPGSEHVPLLAFTLRPGCRAHGSLAHTWFFHRLDEFFHEGLARKQPEAHRASPRAVQPAPTSLPFILSFESTLGPFCPPDLTSLPIYLFGL